MQEKKSTGVSKGEFAHYMLKEIYEQPRAVHDTVIGMLKPGATELNLAHSKLEEKDLLQLQRIIIVASGASRHAGLAGEFMMERLARIPVEVDHASQYCYRDPLTGPDELTILITQSGTTADTLAALREAKSKGSKTLVICNVVDSSIPQQADGTLYTAAGPEISIAATKSFTTQLTALFVLAVCLGKLRGKLPQEKAHKYLEQLLGLSAKMDSVLSCAPHCLTISQKYSKAQDFIFLGRDIDYPIALEGALKLKETCYIHAEGYPTGEFKHGPNAMVDENLPVFVIATRDRSDPGSQLRYEKTFVNIKELSGRGIRVIAVATEGDTEVAATVRDIIFVPDVPVLLQPILEIVPLQLFAYYIAVERGLDVDQPRNLSKSVTVE